MRTQAATRNSQTKYTTAKPTKGHTAGAVSKARKPNPRKDLYQDVTDKVICQLETGTVPWVQPWGLPDVATPLGLPRNIHTGRTYSGINILLLWGAAIETRRTTQIWLTFKQALALGGNVRTSPPSRYFGAVPMDNILGTVHYLGDHWEGLAVLGGRARVRTK